MLPEIRFGYDKPVIYCYSTKPQKTQIQLPDNLQLGFTYPTYHQQWSFDAHPDGRLAFDEKNYRYLFWDAISHELPKGFSTNEGFLVSKTDLLNFFERSLLSLGLNPQEQQDFITYWVPQMLQYDQVFIHFSTAAYNEQFPLTITPQPDWMQRVFMIWADGKHITEKPMPQKLTCSPRQGFAVLEWGGTKIPDVYFHPN